jgi:hypothetical protein
MKSDGKKVGHKKCDDGGAVDKAVKLRLTIIFPREPRG